MPFQIRNLGALSRAWSVGLLVAVVAVPVIVFADGGFYSQSKHGSQTTGVQRDPNLPIGSCTQCHTGHGQNPQDFGLWTSNDNTLCFTCHQNTTGSFFGQTTYSMSGHSSSASSFNNRAVGRCVQCHNPHAAGDMVGVFPKLTAKSEEQVCYTCHGTGIKPQGAVDIQTPSTKQYAHAVTKFQRLHDDNAEMGSVAVNPNPKLSGTSRHVECMDCHNTHYARTTPRAARSSNIGETLLGSWGIRPTYSAAGNQPASYIVERFQSTANEYEAYMCFKCHSNWSWGSTAPYTASGMQETNVAKEFNTLNASYHNVLGQMTPPAEAGGAYVNSWTNTSAMACSDCHASDSTSTARGPHGSINPFMLKKPFQANGTAASGNTGTTGTSSHICFDCHDWNTYGRGGSGNTTNYRKGTDNLHRKSEHQTSLGCFQCHSAVPHGINRKHLIVYTTDGAPYYIGGATGRGVRTYTHANAGSYSESSCGTTSGCH